MATRKKKGGSGGGFGTFLFGFICALLVAGAGGWAYLHFGWGAPAARHWVPTRKQPRNGVPLSGSPADEPFGNEGPVNAGPPSAAAGSQAPVSQALVNQTPANEGAVSAGASAPSPPPAQAAQPVQQPPFDVSEDVFEAGARIYKQQCAACHGVPGHDAAFARQMEPPASQLWSKQPNGSAAGVSNHAPGETFQQVKDGIHLSGMPSYRHVLSDNQIWDVSLLLQNAGQQLPDPVVTILRHP